MRMRMRKDSRLRDYIIPEILMKRMRMRMRVRMRMRRDLRLRDYIIPEILMKRMRMRRE